MKKSLCGLPVAHILSTLEATNNTNKVNSQRVAAGIFGSYQKILEQLLSEYTDINRAMHTCQEVKDGSL